MVQPFFRPQLGDRIDFRFWEDDWSERGRLADAFPHLYGLAPVRNDTIWSAWSGAWTPTLPQALSDQRLSDFLGLQSQLADIQLLEATRDAWIWRQSRFSAKATYRLLCGQMPPEDTHIIQRCRLIWKRRIRLKIRIFSWLLLRRRLMTRAVRQRMYPDSPENCPLRDGGFEDCSHLFFQCPLAQEVWWEAAVNRLSVTSEEAFWSSLSGGFFMREAEWGRIFATLWAIWTHRNEVIFRGITPSGDAIIHTAEGFYLSWHRGSLCLSNHVPLLR